MLYQAYAQAFGCTYLGLAEKVSKSAKKRDPSPEKGAKVQRKSPKLAKTLAPSRAMYRQICPGQLSFAEFYLPFGGKLSATNRWVQLASIIPWSEFEIGYANQFNERIGAPAKPFRMALGALLLKERLGVSDEETVEQIRENPYLQYFLGLHEYSDQAPFEASMLVHFRKRLSIDLLNQINETIALTVIEAELEAERNLVCCDTFTAKEEESKAFEDVF